MAVKTVDDKKSALLYVMKILERYSDVDHPLTQQDILYHLEKDYNITVERRTIGRDIEILKRFGMDITSNKKGSYLASRDFEDSEIRVLIDAVISSRYIPKKYSEDLIEKLQTLSTVYYDPKIDQIKILDDNSKTPNVDVFYNIDLVTEAIHKGKQIKFDFYKYGLDKKLYKSKSHVVTPLQMVLHNQKYYMMAINEKYKTVGFFRIDHIKNMVIIDESVATDITRIKGYEHGISYKQLSVNPYMYSDKPVAVEFLAEDSILDQLVDWFGDYFTVNRSNTPGKLHCVVKVSPKAMELWAMQYINSVEILSPQSLRNSIIEDIEKALIKYKE